MKIDKHLLVELKSLTFWIVIIHIAVFFIALSAGFFIYAFDTKSAGELGLAIAFSSFVWSFPFALYDTVRIKRTEFVDNYLTMGLILGTIVLSIMFLGIIGLRLWCALDGIAQPEIPSPISGAVCLAMIVVPPSLMSSYIMVAQRKRAKVYWSQNGTF
jgi:hypothetical protein